MTHLWPQLPEAVAASVFAEVVAGRERSPATSHENQIWAPIGARVQTKQIYSLIDTVEAAARSFGYPEAAGPDARVAFDRAVAPAIRDHLDLAWADAGSRGLWSFISLIVLPHITKWRFGTDNHERWIASDLTRHTWARLWWQAVVFDGHSDVLAALSESDLNQLLERRSIGGNPRLVAGLATAVISAPSDVAHREIIRDVTRRLRRYLAFIDVRALADQQVDDLCRRLCAESVHHLRAYARK
jgi:hypothetical protein